MKDLHVQFIWNIQNVLLLHELEKSIICYCKSRPKFSPQSLNPMQKCKNNYNLRSSTHIRYKPELIYSLKIWIFNTKMYSATFIFSLPLSGRTLLGTPYSSTACIKALNTVSARLLLLIFRNTGNLENPSIPPCITKRHLKLLSF